MSERELTNRNHEQLAGPHHVDNPVSVLEDLNHHLLLIFGRRSILGMRAGMDDTIHIEIEVIKLFAVRVGARCVDRDDGPIVHHKRLVLDDGGYDLRVLGGQPPKRSGNTHVDGLEDEGRAVERRSACGLGRDGMRSQLVREPISRWKASSRGE